MVPVLSPFGGFCNRWLTSAEPMVDIARADGGRCPRCGARCGCGAARPRHNSVCARRAAFARPPSSPLRLVRPLAPAGADGGAVGAQKAARPSRRACCAPPVAARVRRSRAAAAVGRFGGALAIKRALQRWLVSPRSLPAAPPAPASVSAASSGGGACAPLRAASPPPLLRPRPPFCVGGGGCGFHVSAAAGLETERRPLRGAFVT